MNKKYSDIGIIKSTVEHMLSDNSRDPTEVAIVPLYNKCTAASIFLLTIKHFICF